jgi:hypothetical protein
LTLLIHRCKVDDSGTYSCEIQQYVKEGEPDQTDCLVLIEGK